MSDPIATRRRGSWWRPEASDREVPGELDLDARGGPRLELDRVLADGHPDNQYEVVLGTTRDGQAITLENLRHYGGSTHVSHRLPEPISTEILGATRAYVGAHLPEPKDRRFRRAFFELTDLLTWRGETGFDEKYGRKLDDVTVRLTPPENKAVDLPFGKLVLGQGWEMTGDGRRARGIERSSSFWVDLAEPMDFASLMALIGNPLRYLLTFATDRPNEIERLSVRVEGATLRDRYPVEVVYPRIRDLAPPEDPIGYDFLFDAATLGQRYAEVMSAWFSLYQVARPALNLLFGRLYRPGTFGDNHFLNVAGAAEAYHRSTRKNALIPKTAHRERVKSILATAPAQHRDWLKERLDFSNEPTFRERLVDLHARAYNVVGGVLGSAEEYSAPVVKLRNALTHRGNKKPSDVSGAEIFRLTEQTTFLLTACLLLDLGFDEMQVVEATHRSRRFQTLTQAFIRRKRKPGPPGAATGFGAIFRR